MGLLGRGDNDGLDPGILEAEVPGQQPAEPTLPFQQVRIERPGQPDALPRLVDAEIGFGGALMLEIQAHGDPPVRLAGHDFLPTRARQSRVPAPAQACTYA